jgi:hypothetical protein
MEQATYSFNGWLPNGFKIYFSMPITDPSTAYADALAFTSKLLADGLLQSEPGLEAGEEAETIVTVMRREKGDGTPIIDFYPEWGAGKDEPFGTYKYVHKYMNDETEIADFLAAAGFKSLDEIPLYDGQVPLKRTAGKRHPKETAVPTPFRIVREKGAEKIGSDGKPFHPWYFVRYETANAQSGAGSSQQSAQNAENGHSVAKTGNSDWTQASIKKLIEAHSSTVDELKGALGISGGFSEWTKGYQAAEKALEEYRMAF